METTSTAPMAEAALAQARAEYVTWSEMLRYADAEQARIEAVDGSPMRKLVERSAIALEIGQALGWSEGQVIGRLAAARRVRAKAPSTWLAFSHGFLDAARVREISWTINRLERPAFVEKLDSTVVTYAIGHTVPELRGWLRRFVDRVEADLAVERADRARQDRAVNVQHVDDGMSWLNAFLPTHAAAAIDERLRQTSKPAGEGDDRTRDQRRADTLVDLLLTPTQDGETSAAGLVPMDLAVAIDADVLAGAQPGFATSADGSWSVPADWILDHLSAEHTVFHRLLVDPIIRDILAVEHVGRFAPAQLATAIAFRDGVCQAPGCLRPARDCDLDHREPWPAPTAGENMWPLCRRHHALKGHRVLQWNLPSGHTAPAERTSHGLPTEPITPAAVERAFARTAVEYLG